MVEAGLALRSGLERRARLARLVIAPARFRPAGYYPLDKVQTAEVQAGGEAGEEVVLVVAGDVRRLERGAQGAEGSGVVSLYR